MSYRLRIAEYCLISKQQLTELTLVASVNIHTMGMLSTLGEFGIVRDLRALEAETSYAE